MQLLMHVYSILRFSGPLSVGEIATKLDIRGVVFNDFMLHQLLNLEAAEYFAIRKLRGTNNFMVMPHLDTKSPPMVKITSSDPALAPRAETVFREPIRKTGKRSPNVATAGKKMAAIEFVEKNGRMPSHSTPAEASMYSFIRNHMKTDKDFKAKIQAVLPEDYAPRVGRPRTSDQDIVKVGMQLAESGGVGL